MEPFQYLWRPVSFSEILSLWHFEVELCYFRSSSIALIPNIKRYRFLILINSQIHIAETSVGEAETERVARFNIMLVVPTVSKVVFLNVVARPCVIIILLCSPTLFFVVFRDGKSQFGTRNSVTKNDIHQTIGILLSGHDVEEDCVGMLFHPF